MPFILMDASIVEQRICNWCQEEYTWKDLKWADEKTPLVFSHSSSLNQMYCPNCKEQHNKVELSKGPSHFEKRPTLKGDGRDLFNRIKKRNYGSNMPDY